MEDSNFTSDDTGGQRNDLDWLNHEVRRRNQEVDSLKHRLNELEAETDVLRSEHSVQSADGQLEVHTLETLLGKSQEQLERVERDAARQKRSNRTLKSQNLRLQYLLNSWGIPVGSGGDDERSAPSGQGDDEERTFFPKLSALVEGLSTLR